MVYHLPPHIRRIRTKKFKVIYENAPIWNVYLPPKKSRTEWVRNWYQLNRLVFVNNRRWFLGNFKGSLNKMQEKEHTKRWGSVLMWDSLSNIIRHGSEADFMGFLHKSIPHESCTPPFEPFRFWLRIRGDIRNRRTTPRLAESGSRQDFLELPFFQTFK